MHSRSTFRIYFLFCFAVAAGCVVFGSQEQLWELHAALPESWARASASTKVMPTYPDEAVRLNISGLVHIKLETNAAGEVLRIKVKPKTNSLLAQAVADAVTQWKFKPWPGPDGNHVPVFSRLTFDFRLNNQQPHVEMYDPGPLPSDIERLSYYNSAKEKREWRDWEEVTLSRPNSEPN
jgi:TonB family protein